MRIVIVYEVLHDTDTDGPAGDGTVIARFRKEDDAKRFSSNKLCYGFPATVNRTEVPRRIAQRWGMA